MKRRNEKSLTGAIWSREVESGDLSAAAAKDANKLAFVGQTRFKPRNGVEVDVARNDGLFPRRPCVFLGRGKAQ